MWVSVGHADLVMKRTSPFLGSQIADSFPLHLDLPPADAAGGQTEEPSMQPDSHSSPHYSDRTRPMMTYREAADLMVISPRTLQRAAAVGDLSVVRVGHRTVRIRREDL